MTNYCTQQDDYVDCIDPAYKRSIEHKSLGHSVSYKIYDISVPGREIFLFSGVIGIIGASTWSFMGDLKLKGADDMVKLSRLICHLHIMAARELPV